MTILVTGASGFIGYALTGRLVVDGYTVRAALRQSRSMQKGVECIAVGAITPETDWAEALADVSVVIHSAARAHVLDDIASDLMATYQRINCESTLALARSAYRAGVRRFVFVSSILVNGSVTNGRPFSERGVPNPSDAYAHSKWHAEIGLQQLAAETGLEVVIVRPPLVYGPGVKGNMLKLMRLVKSGWPLPVGGVKNRRSLIALDNLTDILSLCAFHPKAGGNTFIVSDGEDISTPDIIRQLSIGMGRPLRLFSMPIPLLTASAILTGQRRELEKLCGDLQVDSSCIRQLLGWEPLLQLNDGLRQMAAWFVAEKK